MNHPCPGNGTWHAGGCHAIVLAGGRGRRLAERSFDAWGRPVPKQYACFESDRSLLQQTVARIRGLWIAHAIHVCVDGAYGAVARRQLRGVDNLRIIEQAKDRGTAAGVMLSILEVLDEAPDALILLTPADHGVEDGSAYARGIFHAVRALRQGSIDIVLLGAPARAASTDHGWIVPGPALSRGVRRVETFVEKPEVDLARRIWSRGGVWNTMVLVARAATLWSRIAETVPGLGVTFGTARTMSEPRRSRYLRRRYESMPSFDFSRDVLERCEGLALVEWDSELGWTDLGTASRLDEWLDRRGARWLPAPLTADPARVGVREVALECEAPR